MMSTISKLTVLAGSLALAFSASAVTVYDSGAPDGFNGNEATHWLQTDDFSVATGTSINQATVFLGGLSGSNGLADWDQSLRYFIFSDASGPSAVLASGNVSSYTLADTGIPLSFSAAPNVQALTFALPSFSLAANTTYWFGIHLAADYASRNDIYWITTSSTGRGGMESESGTLNNWLDNNNNHAFLLSNVAAVPEPETYAMMFAGLGVLGFMGRRNKTR